VNSDWLSAQSYQDAHAVLAAVNRVSIDMKLSLTGHSRTTPPSEHENARVIVSRFLERLDDLLRHVRAGGPSFIAGVDPRLESLAHRYLHETRQRPRRSSLASTTPGEMRLLMQSVERTDQERLVACLRDLRVLLEQHTYVDLGRLLGEIYND
jgi:hypothetical protein